MVFPFRFAAAIPLAALAAASVPVGLKDLVGFALSPASRAPSAVPNYTLQTLDPTAYPNARCLDGTQGAYYHRPAQSAASANKWRIFFQGGGWCVSDADCYGRSQTALGSNLNLTETAADPAGYCGASFLSGDPQEAPGFWDWHAVYVPYCDGSSMTGKNETVTIVQVSRAGPWVLGWKALPLPEAQGAEVHYKGGFIRDAFVADLLSKAGAAAGTDFAVGGCSAGGLTTYLGIDAVRAALPSSARVVGVRTVPLCLFERSQRTNFCPPPLLRQVPDAGFFLDHPDMNGQPFRTPLFQWGFEAWNSSAALSPACLAHYAPTGDTWRCIFAQYTARASLLVDLASFHALTLIRTCAPRRPIFSLH